ILRNLLNNPKENEITQDPQPDERLREPAAVYSDPASREIQLLRQRIADLERTILYMKKNIEDKEELIRLLKQKL
ncbi:MAG: hypothetical protein U0L38_01220, partial [Bacteroidales bacterium]|nr:hypothetical protein [Bacteroidales bacterium]